MKKFLRAEPDNKRKISIFFYQDNTPVQKVLGQWENEIWLSLTFTYLFSSFKIVLTGKHFGSNKAAISAEYGCFADFLASHFENGIH